MKYHDNRNCHAERPSSLSFHSLPQGNEIIHAGFGLLCEVGKSAYLKVKQAAGETLGGRPENWHGVETGIALDADDSHRIFAIVEGIRPRIIDFAGREGLVQCGADHCESQ